MLLLWVLVLVLVVAVLGAGWWGYRYYRADQHEDDDAGADAGAGQALDTGDAFTEPAEGSAVEGLGGLADDAGASAAATAGDSNQDPVAAFGLDPDEWAPMADKGRRMAYFRGLVRGASRPARLVGEPDVIFEHRDGRLAVGLDAARAYEGHPEWAEVSALTLQMGMTKLRWPKAEVTGVIRYTDCSVPLPYKQELYTDLRRAARSHKDKELPEANELAASGERSSARTSTTPEPDEEQQGLMARLRSGLNIRHLLSR